MSGRFRGSKAARLLAEEIEAKLDSIVSLLTQLNLDLVSVDSTTEVLGENEEYKATSFSLVRYSKIVGSVFADQPGTLYVEQSQDNQNWDVVSSYPVAVNVGVGFMVEVVARYGRVRYVNGATVQTVFRLHTNVKVI